MREYTRFQPSEDEDDDEISRMSPPVLASRTKYLVFFSWLWRTLMHRGIGVENARVNHQFSAKERAKLDMVESIDYLPPNSAVYRRWLERQPHRRLWDRWFMMGSIGVVTGVTAYLLYVLISVFASFKYGATRWLILRADMLVAWLFNAALTAAMATAASYLCVRFAPAAIGSGVPEVMAYLNGCQVPKIFNVATLGVKLASCALAVSSGLPVGPEGPLVHIGAAIGSALSQGHSTSMGFSTQLFKRFRNPKDKRDFVTAGVSVGVAAAFNAPIGGLLFAFEEVASFWQHSLGWQLFFACMCAILTLNLLKSAGRALMDKGTFGWFDKDVTFEVDLAFSSHVLAVVPAALIGLLAGVLGVLFTVATTKVARLRNALAPHLRGYRRCAEAGLLGALYVTGCMLLPLFFPCTRTECVFKAGQASEMQCQSGLPSRVSPPPYYPVVPPPYGPGDMLAPPSTPPPPSSPSFDDDGAEAEIPRHASSLSLYTCKVVEHNATASAAGSITPRDLNSSATVYYNQLATLLFSTGEEGIKHLLTRGTHRRFGYKALFVTGGWYLLFSVLCSGAALSSGLFVPMLFLGAVLGRLVGLATVDVATYKYGKTWNIDSQGPWSWIDPGAFALVGAGAFMGGATRMTISLAVIMIEVSSDVHMLLPVLVAIMVAKWVGDAVTHSLYHGLLEVKCVPFLPPEPSSKLSLDLLPVSLVMKAPVVCLRRHMKVWEITEVLKAVNHNGFPVLVEECVYFAVQQPQKGISPVATRDGREIPGSISVSGRGVGGEFLVLRTPDGKTVSAEAPGSTRVATFHEIADGVVGGGVGRQLRFADEVAESERPRPTTIDVSSSSAASGEGTAPPGAAGDVGAGKGVSGAEGGAGTGGSASASGARPALESEDSRLVCCGLITRSHLMALLQRIIVSGSTEGLCEVEWPELNRKMMDPVDAQQNAASQQMAVLEREMGGGGARAAPGQNGNRGRAAGGSGFAHNGRQYGDVADDDGDDYDDDEDDDEETGLLAQSGGAESTSAAWGLRYGDTSAGSRFQGLDPNLGRGASRFGSGGGGGGSGHPLLSLSSNMRSELGDGVVDLMPYVNTSAFMVPDSFSIERTYILFRTMGLRHLVVVDRRHRVVGIVTRKDLLGFRLDDALTRALNGGVIRGTRSRAAPLMSPGP